MEDKVVKRGQWLMREALFGMLRDRISNALCDCTQCKICRGAQPCAPTKVDPLLKGIW